MTLEAGRRAAAIPGDATLPMVAALVVGLAGAVALRVGVGGVDGVRSPAAGLVFAAVLAGLCWATRRSALPLPRQPWHLQRPRGVPGVRGVLVPGVVLAAVLCVVPLVVHLQSPGASLDARQLPVWLVVVSAVAVAEEAFLRGALWDAAAGMRGGERTALVVTTVVFAVIHLPFYGPASLPLNLAVGLLLGGVRQWTGGWAAPAVAHTLADICGWWLR